MADEYSDSIDKFTKPKKVSIQMPQQENYHSQVNSSDMTDEQINYMQQQQMQQQMQQQQMQQQQMQQQQMQQQHLQQHMQQNIQLPSENLKNDSSLLTKLKNLNFNKTLQEVLVISVLFIIFSSSFYKDTITKYISIITVSNNELNTIGLLISAILLSVIFVITRTFI